MLTEDAPAPKKIVAMELEPEIIEQLQKLKGQGDWNTLMKQLLQERTEQLEKEKPEAVQTDARHIPNKIQRYVSNRTNGTCAYPGCTNPIKIKHHTQRFALEKIHDSDRLHGMCKAHERIAHLGLIENEQEKAQNWKLRLEADKSSPTYAVDEIVNKFRAPR